MAKFIDLTEIYGNCFINNQSIIHGKIYNNDLLYVSFSQIINETYDKTLVVSVRKFDNTITNSGVPTVHFWFSDEGCDAISNQAPNYVDDIGFGTLTITCTSGYMLDPTLNTTINDGTYLNTAIVNSTTHDLRIRLYSFGDDLTYTKFLNVFVQGMVYSEKFTIGVVV